MTCSVIVLVRFNVGFALGWTLRHLLNEKHAGPDEKDDKEPPTRICDRGTP